MIIKSITLCNFYCYAGTVEFQFKEGLNVIIGDNGSGKSKLYDAFYWLLYDECFNTELREFQKTETLKSIIVSDKAKYEAAIGETVEAKVSVIFYMPDNVTSTEYKIERSYKIIKLAEQSLNADAWKTAANSELSILEKEVLNFRAITHLPDIDMNSFINKKILPPNIKDYMWFQGEQVDNLINFKNYDTLTKAINALSDISAFDNMIEIARKAFETAKKEYQVKLKTLSSSKQDSDLLETQKIEAEKQLTNLFEEQKLNNQTLMQAEEEKQAIYNKVEDAKKIAELNAAQKEVESNLKQIHEQLTREKKELPNLMFTQYWILNDLDGLIDEYATRFKAYEDEKLRKKHFAEFESGKKMQNRLPINVPAPIYIEKMLDAEKCLVCDRHAPKDSDAWLKIQELLPKQASPKPPLILTKQDFRSDWLSIYETSNRLRGKVEQIENNQQSAMQSIHQLDEKRIQQQQRLTLLKEEIRNLVERSAITTDGSYNIVAAFEGHNRKYNQAKERETILNRNIKQLEENIQNINNRLRGLVKEPIPKVLEDKFDILQTFHQITLSTRDRVFNRLIQQLENEANKHYKSMTLGNRAFKGLIKIVKQREQNYMPKIVDDEGNELAALNDANMILFKLSVIMAIISAKKTSDATRLYTLITDAPSSKFNDDYTIGFCKTVSQVYTQSIIMSKDFYSNQHLRQLLLKDVEKLGNIYEITPSVSEKDRNNRNLLSTYVKLIRKI